MTPGRGRMRGGAQDPYSSGGVLDGREDVDARAGERDDLEEVGREDGVGLGAQERRPGGGGAFWRWVDAGLFEDLPDSGHGGLEPEHEEFAVDAAVPPRVVLLG